METVGTLQDVRTFETRGGNVRYVARDSEGNEYTTFREEIGKAAEALQGRGVRIEFHEEQRGQYTNAAPWLVGQPKAGKPVPPYELYEKLKPFEEKVAEDIKEQRDAV